MFVFNFCPTVNITIDIATTDIEVSTLNLYAVEKSPRILQDMNGIESAKVIFSITLILIKVITFLSICNLSTSTFENTIPNVTNKKAVIALFPLPIPKISLLNILGNAKTIAYPLKITGNLYFLNQFFNLSFINSADIAPSTIG